MKNPRPLSMLELLMILYLVRHGESEANKNNFHHTPEVPLSSAGLLQANEVAKRFKNIHIDLIYSSPMIRAKQTAEVISKKVGVPVEYWDDLSEMRQPVEIRGKSVDDLGVIKIRQTIEKNKDRKNYHFSDEENFNDIDSRAQKVLEHLESNHSDQMILCVSHSTYIKALVGKIIFSNDLTEKIFLEMRKHLWVKNTGITVCEKHPKYGWQLNMWNDSSHL